MSYEKMIYLAGNVVHAELYRAGINKRITAKSFNTDKSAWRRFWKPTRVPDPQEIEVALLEGAEWANAVLATLRNNEQIMEPA